jgi:type II secretory pathway pseudopilin PulG
LIELIVVIIILGILAATALPRFAALQTQARIAKLNGALGAMKGAASLAHAACLASQPQCTATLPMEGVNVTMVNAYPTADAAGSLPRPALRPGRPRRTGSTSRAAGRRQATCCSSWSRGTIRPLAASRTPPRGSGSRRYSGP